ncbi:MAG: DegT/DnrJ/EryC1/StrS family aminotransferase [Woeseiaceae bacterium]
MPNKPLAPWPSYTPEEVDSVSRVLSSNRVSYWTGTECREFEKEFAHELGVEHAIALANGTLALEIALRALDIGPGDEVVVTPRSFVASASCVVASGARPVFADVDAETQNVTAATIRDVLTSKTRGVICVHLAGYPCDMDAIMALASEHDLKIIEDCAQAHGARYRNQMVGSIGHIGAWSFCQDKIMTTGGEGGMVTTRDRDLWSRMWSYKDHGKSWESVYEREHAPGFPWRHDTFGSNYRMLEIQAVLGRIQLKKLPEWMRHRQRNAAILDKFMAAYDCIRRIQPPDHVTHSYYRFDMFVRPERLREGWSRDRIIAECIARGVPAYFGACPEIYREKAFQNAGFAPRQRLPMAKALGETCIQFLVHPTLDDQDMEFVGRSVAEVLEQAQAG